MPGAGVAGGWGDRGLGGAGPGPGQGEGVGQTSQGTPSSVPSPADRTTCYNGLIGLGLHVFFL